MQIVLEIIVEFIMELFLEAGLEGAENTKLPRKVRIGCMIFSSLLLIAFIIALGYLFLAWENIILRIIAIGVILLVVSILISLWWKFLKSSK